MKQNCFPHSRACRMQQYGHWPSGHEGLCGRCSPPGHIAQSLGMAKSLDWWLLKQPQN